MGRIYEATWGRGFAALYDRMLAATEEAGLRQMRRELLRGARGRTIDIGAGTGANIDFYPAEVDELVLAEPSPHMARRLRRRAASAARRSEVVEAPAERLPFPDDSFDTAVFTLVLCTVPDPEAAVSEAGRVLRPGGRLLFLEHVRSESQRTARWQDRLERPWRFIGAGCHCNRDTGATIGQAGLEIESLEQGELPKSPPIVRPLIRGVATAPQGR
jgi:ubiquinone/menaquinone biosynthesis C-methylase UbiE